MSNCLGIYTENNIVKYAKLTSGKDGNMLNLVSYGVRFGDNKKEIIDTIIKETNSSQDIIATNIVGEKYSNVEVFNKLSKKDIKDLVEAEFENACKSDQLLPSIFDMRFKLIENTGDPDKNKAVCISTYRSDIEKIIRDFSEYKVKSLSPLGTSVINILPNRGTSEQAAIVSINEETVVTVIINGQVADFMTIPIGMKDVISKLAEKYNSYSKAYEACKGVSAYIEDIYTLDESDRDVLDLVIPMLYELRARIEAYLIPFTSGINKIYLTGTGTIINNLDLYFAEVFSEKECQILVPYFLPKESSNINDIIEVNTAVSLAFNGLGYNDKDIDFLSGSVESAFQLKNIKNKLNEVKERTMSFIKSTTDSRKQASNPKVKKPSKKRKIDFNDEVVDTQVEESPMVQFKENGREIEQNFGNERPPLLTGSEEWLLRVAGATLISACLYSGASIYTQNVIDEKTSEINETKANVNAMMQQAQADKTSIDREIDKYITWEANLSEMINKVTTREVSFDIPNFMSKLMFTIPENVRVTDMEITPESVGETKIEKVKLRAESGKYAQLGYFVSRLKLDKVLEKVDMKVIDMNNVIKIEINGELP